MQIRDTIAVVTGGASGLGAATARALADKGARVALLDYNADAATSLAESIGGIGVACDVSSEEGAAAAMATVQQALGVARILVNCAGIAPAKKILGKQGVMPLDEFRRAIEINLVGTFNILRLFALSASGLDPLEGEERGVAINTASIAGYDGQIGQTAYAASKAGVIGLTLPAARELASVGIRVCTIAPGIFETPMLKGLPEPAQKSLGQMVPFPPRLGTTRRICGARAPHHRKPDAQRRDRPARRRNSHGAEMTQKNVKSPWPKAEERERERGVKREALLNAAVQSFNEKGFHATSLDEIAASLNVTKPTVYYYFANKDEFLFECVRLGLESIAQAADAAEKSGGSGLERLRALMRDYALIMTRDFGMCVIRTADYELSPESRKKFRALKRQIDDIVRGVVADGIADGSIAKGDPRVITFALTGALNWIARWYQDGRQYTPDAIADACVETLINGLAPRQGGRSA